MIGRRNGMRPGRTAALARVVIAGLMGLSSLTFATVYNAPQAEAKRKLSCSFIAKQCRRECSRQMDANFCAGYCSDMRHQCLQTGQWQGISRQFTNVTRR
jgi:hypothetical protein